MLEKVKKWCRENELFASGDALVLACSGGPDSLALVDVFLQLREEYRLQLKVGHLDHMFRGEASRADAAFVADYCQKNGLDCEVRSVDVPAYAARHGLSDETAAREVRYAFLRELAQGFGGARIATAHHRGDQAETMLLHLFRGAGSRGLTGIRPQAAGIIRPFLSVTRLEIEAYCRSRELQPRFDATNAETDYRRNRIRLELMPELKKNYNPALEEALCRTATLLADEHAFIHAAALAVWPQAAVVLAEQVRLNRSCLLQQARALQRELWRLAIEKLQGDVNGIGFVHMEQLLDFAVRAKAGTVLQLPRGLHLHCRYDVFELSYKQLPAKADFSIELQVPGVTLVEPLQVMVQADFVETYEKSADRFSLLCDAAKLHGRLLVRNRRAGDRFSPSGLRGTKKLKEFFIDAKIDRDQRDRILLFCDEQAIFWVGGYRQNNESQVNETTRRFLRLCIKDLPERGES